MPHNAAALAGKKQRMLAEMLSAHHRRAQVTQQKRTLTYLPWDKCLYVCRCINEIIFSVTSDRCLRLSTHAPSKTAPLGIIHIFEEYIAARYPVNNHRTLTKTHIRHYYFNLKHLLTPFWIKRRTFAYSLACMCLCSSLYVCVPPLRLLRPPPRFYAAV